jgi:hypothetical protein
MANKIRFILLLLITGTLYFCSDTSNNTTPKNRVYQHLKPSLVVNLPEELFESSGLLYDEKKLWTINDNGGLPCLYQIDTITGTIVQKVFIDNCQNNDWEEITADENYIYIGDFGNNFGNRQNLSILKIDKKKLTDKKEIHINAEVINFGYEMQKNFKYNENTSFDCEAMISIDSCLYLFSMNRSGEKCVIYKMPKTPGTHKSVAMHHFFADGRITGATYNKSLNVVLLIGYSVKTNNPFVWRIKDFEKDNFLQGHKEYFMVGDEKTWQIEAITFVNNNKALFSCETSGDKVAGIYQLILD